MKQGTIQKANVEHECDIYENCDATTSSGVPTVILTFIYKMPDLEARSFRGNFTVIKPINKTKGKSNWQVYYTSIK